MMHDGDPRARYAVAARLWNELVAEMHGVDDDGDRVFSLTPAGGAAVAYGAPFELRTALTTRLAANPLALGEIEKAAAFLDAWAAWIAQEEGRSDGTATSMFEHACRPVKAGQRGWSAFGGAALALDRQASLALDGASLAPVRALQSIAAGLRAIHPARSGTHGGPMNARELLRFCNPDPGSRIHTPWSVGGKTYACDGHILIEVDRLVDVSEREDAPDLSGGAIWPVPHGNVYLPLPDVGSAPGPKTCEECGGYGEVEFSRYSHVSREVFRMDGECPVCDGTGKTEPPDVGVQIGGMYLNERYIRLINECLRNPEVTAVDAHRVHLRFDGGEGALMQMRRPE